MLKLKQGDLCLFDFDPSVGHEYQGKRPAVVVESDKQISATNLVTVIPLTSNLNNLKNDDFIIKKDGANRLFADSVVKVCYINSFDYKRLVNKIGRVDGKVMNRVKGYLKIHFGI